jgi:hypothetical protein
MSVFHNDYGPHGFEALAINVNESMDSIVKVWARQNTNVYLRDPNTVWPVYTHNNAYPLNYVIDTAGVIRYWAEGYNEAAVRAVIEQYLPDKIEHDVGVSRLIAPIGSVDSGTVVTPACSLRNYRGYAETYPVRMRIGADYDTTVTVTNHQPSQTVYVEFPQWTALARGNGAVSCSTELADDDIGSNNVAKSTVTVNVDDIAVSAILAPADTEDLGRGVVPAAEVKNLGTLADMAKVRFYIGDFYVDSVNVPLQPGKTDTAVLDIWTPALLGTFPVRCTCATLKTDLVTTNNELSTSVVVQPAGIEEQLADPTQFALLVSRNPATTSATIRYSLAAASYVDLSVFSANGTLVRTLRSGVESPGPHDATWDGRDDSGRRVGRGTYFCCLTAGDFRASRQIVLIE